MICLVRVVVIVMLGIVPCTLSAQDGQDPTVGYDLDLRLGYYDKLHNPFAGSGGGSDAEGQSGGKERALGLTRARAEVWWWLPEESRLRVVVRPDALNDGDHKPTREFDARAGEVYQQRPDIKLLDAYQIEKHFGDQLEISVGVYEALVTRAMAYAPLLEFGLEVQMPQKSSAAELEWRLMEAQPDVSPPQPESGWVFNVKAFQGDRDRVEEREFSDQTYDQAPTAQDPHYGANFSLTRVNGHTNRFGILVGMSDNRYREVNDAGMVTATGKRNEVFGQVLNELYINNLLFPAKIALDYRLAKEKWKGDKLDISPRTHQSAALTSSVEVGALKWALLGVHWASSQYDDDTDVTGYQLDLGYKLVVAKNLWVTFMAAEEHRQKKSAGETTGAFVKQNGDDDKVLRRYAAEIAYVLQED